MSSRPAWSAERVLGQPELLHREILSQKKQKYKTMMHSISNVHKALDSISSIIKNKEEAIFSGLVGRMQSGVGGRGEIGS